MEYLSFALIALSLLLVVLMIFLAKSKKANEIKISDAELYRIREEIRLSLVGEFERMSSSLDSSLIKSYEQTIKLNDQVSVAFSRINASNRESMDAIFRQLSSIEKSQADKLLSIQGSLYDNLDRIRKANNEAFVDISNKSDNLTKQVRDGLDLIRKDNNAKLDEMRSVVDEKLQETLDKRIVQSFKVVNESLEKLHQSLGSLNALTSDVQSINKIFSNVKSRGIWGEVQAESILNDILAKDQFVKDYSPRNNREKVEFAIKLPGKDNSGSVYLPIDSKFPTTDYVKYKEAVDMHDEAQIASSLKAVKERVLSEAKDIQKKYIVTPETTDFGILFVPAESIYIELLRIPDFADRLQNEQRVILSGPNNFAALLNSLRLGFKTLQIERYTCQIWHSFETLKKYFSDLAKAIDDSKKAVDKASDELESASKKKEKLSTVITLMENSSAKQNLVSFEEYKDQHFLQ